MTFLLLFLIITVRTMNIKKSTSKYKTSQIMSISKYSIGALNAQYKGWKIEWIFFSYGVRGIAFDAQTSNDIYIGFSNELKTKDPMYEIVIGGWANTRTVVRRKSQGTVICSVNKGFANPGLRTSFTVTLDENNQKIIVKQNGNTIIECTDRNFIKNLSAFDFSSWDKPIAYSNINSLNYYTHIDPCVQIDMGPKNGEYNMWKEEWSINSFGIRQIAFDAKTSNDIVVGFSDELKTKDPMYEIVIGGWANTRTVVRRKSQGTVICSVNKGFANPGLRTSFTVTLDENNQKIIVKQNENTIIECTDRNFIQNLSAFDFSSWNRPVNYWLNCQNTMVPQPIIISP